MPIIGITKAGPSSSAAIIDIEGRLERSSRRVAPETANQPATEAMAIATASFAKVGNMPAEAGTPVGIADAPAGVRASARMSWSKTRSTGTGSGAFVHTSSTTIPSTARTSACSNVNCD